MFHILHFVSVLKVTNLHYIFCLYILLPLRQGRTTANIEHDPFTCKDTRRAPPLHVSRGLYVVLVFRTINRRNDNRLLMLLMLIIRIRRCNCGRFGRVSAAFGALYAKVSIRYVLGLDVGLLFAFRYLALFFQFQVAQ